MIFEKKRILNIDVLSITRQQLLDNLNEGLLITPNLDHLVKLQEDKDFYNIYQKADWVVCDSRVLYIIMKLTGRGLPEAIPGSTFFRSFYQYHRTNEECRIFLLGSMGDVAKIAREKINNSVNREIVVGALSPSYGFEEKQEECEYIYGEINQSGANVVLVGLGAPKQEKWIMAHKNMMPNVKLWMALGATIDFEAGYLKRAPLIYQKLALEWLYRIKCEPKRMLKRYLCDDLVFFWYLFKQLIGYYKNPFV